MKKIRVLLLFGAGLMLSCHQLFAQTDTLGGFNTDTAPVQATPPDSIVQVTAEAQGLSLVPADQIPPSGTFWWVMQAGAYVPMPCPPLDMSGPIYQIADGQFLADDTGGQVLSGPRRASSRAANISVVSALETQANTVINLIAQVQATAARRQMRTMSTGLFGPPGLGDGDTNSYDYYSPNFPVQVFTTNDLWLQITGTTNYAATNITAFLVIHHPWNVTNGVYDLFATTNLVPSAWRWVLRCAPGQTNLPVTNLTSAINFFILGLTNDTDGGGLSDAYEKLVTQTDPNNASDDLTTPRVGIQVTDAVAVAQEAGNTATFVISRLGGYMGQPLTVTCGLSGTAVVYTDYTLSTGSVLGTNLSVTIPAGETNVAITLTAVNVVQTNGSETATLTLEASSVWTNDPANASATVWILEDYTKVYTSNIDFNLGVMSGLEAVNNQLQFKTNLPPQFPFINVACSYRGTVARINTTNGMVLGEYRTTPLGLSFTGLDGPGSQPSRTTVDQYGNVWVANRDDTLSINGTNYGSITRIGLIIGGTRYQKNSDGTYTTNAFGQYVSLTDANYNTCTDRDGDGYIRTSSGLADILRWNNDGGVDSQGGVSTAEDEAITEYTRVPCTGTRTIAVDRWNDIWVGGHTGNRTHLKVNGLLGLPVPNSAFDPYDSIDNIYWGGYGGVIDGLGNLWSSDGAGLVWLTPPTNLPPQTTDWQALIPPGAYGIAVDPLHPYIWQTTGGNGVFRWNTNGTPAMTNADGTTHTFYHGDSSSQGLAVDANGHVWVAHGKGDGSGGSTTVGHLNTNATFIGNVTLQVNGLWAEYFGNTNLSGWPLLASTDYNNPVDYSWTNNWPDVSVPTNQFSARWSGIVSPQTQGDHVFYVRADTNAIFRLTVNGTVIIDNWTHPAITAVELSGTNWLGTNIAYDLKLEYVHFTNGAAVTLLWQEPGATEVVIPLDRFQKYPSGPTGISVDAAGKIWAACYDSSSAVRIDPNAGALTYVDGVTNHVGLVDMVVDLGNDPGNLARPYNYSDMTGFNERVVNPTIKPFKGYWVVTDDSGHAGQLWNKVSWSNSLPTGCSIEVYVRAADARPDLGSAVFVQATNNVKFSAIRGRYIEVRLGMTRDDASKQPVLYDLTLYGVSSGFAGDYLLDDTTTYERQDATFIANLTGAAPLTYQWFRMYPWETNWVQVAGATNSTFTITNVDSWVDGTLASCVVSNETGEVLSLGPAELWVYPLAITIPTSGSSGQASHYPSTINVFGQPTNLASATVSLWDLSHARSADLNILLVSPSGTNVMLISHIGGTNGVSHANLVFQQGWSQPSESGAIPAGQTSTYSPSNYGQKTQLPGAPAGYYSINLYNLIGNDPNGAWRLYIYDDTQGAVGQLLGSWSLNFTFQ